MEVTLTRAAAIRFSESAVVRMRFAQVRWWKAALAPLAPLALGRIRRTTKARISGARLG
jgi:hypothetical protein